MRLKSLATIYLVLLAGLPITPRAQVPTDIPALRVPSLVVPLRSAGVDKLAAEILARYRPQPTTTQKKRQQRKIAPAPSYKAKATQRALAGMFSVNALAKATYRRLKERQASIRELHLARRNAPISIEEPSTTVNAQPLTLSPKTRRKTFLSAVSEARGLTLTTTAPPTASANSLIPIVHAGGRLTPAEYVARDALLRATGGHSLMATCVVGNVSPTANLTALQACASAAAFGDTIELTAGAEHRGAGLSLPDRGAGSSYITITTDSPELLPAALDSYPALGEDGYPQRVTTAAAASMPKIQTNSAGGASAIILASGAHHWKLYGIEIATHSTGVNITSLISTDALASYLYLDHCWLHPQEETGDLAGDAVLARSLERGINFNGDHLYVYNSSFQGITGSYYHATSSARDSIDILWGGGAGQGEFANNLLESMANNIFFGGAGGVQNPAHTAVVVSGSIASNGQLTVTLTSTTDLDIGDYFAINLSGINAAGNCVQAYQEGAIGCVSGWSNARVLTVNHSTNVVTAQYIFSNYSKRRQRITIFNQADGYAGRYPSAISGTFTLTLDGETTGAITYSSNGDTLAANIQAALEALPGIASGTTDVRTTFSPPSQFNYVEVDFGDASAIVGYTPTNEFIAPTCNPLTTHCGSKYAYPNAAPPIITGNASGLSGVAVPLVESHAFGVEYGRGTFVEPGFGEPVAGNAVAWEGLGIENVLIRRNIIAKYAGPGWWATWGNRKGYTEPKTCVNCTYDGNLIFWDGASQFGPGFMVGTPHHDGGCSWCQLTNLTLSNNWFQGAVFMSNQFMDAIHFGPVSTGLTITNNLQTVPNNLTTSSPEYHLSQSAGNMVVTHNTFILGAGRFMNGLVNMTSAVVKDNIVRAGNLFFCLGTPTILPPYTLPPDCWPATDEENQQNLIINDQGWLGDISDVANAKVNTNWLNYWPNQLYTTDAFSDQFFAPNSHKWWLKDDSEFKGQASDATDPGVNFATMIAAAGVDWFGFGTPAAPGAATGVRGRINVRGRVTFRP